MNLKNFFIPLLAVATMVSCSKDDDLGPQEPDMTPDCWFSLAVDTDTQTKTRANDEKPETDPTLPRNIISDLAVFVYIDGKYYTHKDTALTVDQIAAGNVTLNSVNRIPVKSGNVKVLVVANAGTDKIAEIAKTEKLSDVLSNVSVLLDKEKHKSLTMSSEVFEVTLKVSKNNYAGFNGKFPDSEINGVDVAGATNPLRLYRNVARVQLSTLSLAVSSEFGTPKKFVLDTVFLANVKRYSYLCPTDGKPWGPVECPIDDEQYWWFGACPGIAFGDSLTDIKTGEVTPLMNIPFDKKYDNQTSYYGEQYSVEPITLTSGNRTYPIRENGDPINPIGHFFYVYENAQVKSPTLLVLRGSYTYTIPGTAKDTTVYNRFYPVIVNDKGKGTGFEGVAVHDYVKRNTQYSINLTISGPGSDKPYDPTVRAYVGGTVKVLNWGVIEVVQSAD